MTATVPRKNSDLIRSVFRRIMLPALIAGASANIAGMIDGIIVGNTMGSDALAAVNACRPAMQVYGFFSEILASGLGNCIAGAIGRNDKSGADRTFTAGMLAALIAAVVMTAGQIFFADGICRVFAADETLFPLALEYYRVFLFCSFFVLACEPLTAVMRSDGYPVLSALVLLIPPFLNAGLDVLFVSVWGMGLRGAATATVLAYVLGFLLCCYYFFFRRSYRVSLKETGGKLAEIVSAGTPPAVNVGLITVKLLIVNGLAQSAGGPDGMAVMSVLMTAWALESLFIGGVGQTMMPMISFYYANGDYHGVRTVFSHAFRVLMGSEAALALLIELFPQVLPTLLGVTEPALLATAVLALRIFAAYLLMESFLMLAIIYYSATGNKKAAVLLSVLQGVAALVAVIYPMTALFGLTGVWLAFPVSGLIPLAVLAVQTRGSAERFFRMKGHTYLQEFSVDRAQLSGTVASVIRALGEAGLEPTVANRAGIAVEEMAVSAFERNSGSRLHVDVTVRRTEDGSLLITFADDGAEFDPTRQETGNIRENLDSLTVLKAVSCKIEYGRVIGVNKTDITLR